MEHSNKKITENETPLYHRYKNDELWRYHFCRRIFSDTHGSIFIGSKEITQLQTNEFKIKTNDRDGSSEALDSDQDFFNEIISCDEVVDVIKKGNAHDTSLYVDILDKMMEILNNNNRRPLLLLCNTGTGTSAAFVIAYLTFLNIHSLKQNPSLVKPVSLDANIERVRSCCANLFTSVPLVNSSYLTTFSHNVYVGFRQVLDPTITDHAVWLKTLQIWYSKLLKTELNKQQQQLYTNLVFTPDARLGNTFANLIQPISQIVRGQDQFEEEFDEPDTTNNESMFGSVLRTGYGEDVYETDDDLEYETDDDDTEPEELDMNESEEPRNGSSLEDDTASTLEGNENRESRSRGSWMNEGEEGMESEDDDELNINIFGDHLGTGPRTGFEPEAGNFVQMNNNTGGYGFSNELDNEKRMNEMNEAHMLDDDEDDERDERDSPDSDLDSF